MTDSTTSTTEPVITPELERRRKQLEVDDPATYPTGRHWNRDFAKPRYSRLGDKNPYYIEPELRPYVDRTPEEDARILAELPNDHGGLITDCDPNGPPMPVSMRDPEFLLHAMSVRHARARKKDGLRAAVDVRRGCSRQSRVGVGRPPRSWVGAVDWFAAVADADAAGDAVGCHDLMCSPKCAAVQIVAGGEGAL